MARASGRLARPSPGLISHRAHPQDGRRRRPLRLAASPGDGLWHPFVFRTSAPAIGPAPLQVTQSTLQPVAGGLELLISVVPREPGLTVSFALPPGVVPARHNLPGLVRVGSWTATFIAVPAEGVLFRAAFNTTDRRWNRHAARSGHVRQAPRRRRLAVPSVLAPAGADSLDGVGHVGASRGVCGPTFVTLISVTATVIDVMTSRDSGLAARDSDLTVRDFCRR